MGCGSSQQVVVTAPIPKADTSTGHLLEHTSPVESGTTQIAARPTPASGSAPAPVATVIPRVCIVPPIMEEASGSMEVSDAVNDTLYGRSVSKESTDSTYSNRLPNDEKKRKHIKYAITKLETEEVLNRLDQCFHRLHHAEDLSTYDCHKDLEFIRCASRVNTSVERFSDQDRRPIFVQRMVERNITSLLLKVWNQAFQPAFRDASIEYYYAMQNITITVWNSTDFSQELCNQILQQSGHVQMLRYLDNPLLVDPSQDDKKVYITKGYFGILTNLLQKVNVRQDLRDNGAVKIVQKYSGSENSMLQCKVAIIMAYLMDEDESDMLNSDDKNIAFIIKILKNALQNKDHTSRMYGYRADEVIHALNLLAANENNKTRIVDNGALPYYVQMLQGDAQAEEQELAAEGLWSLAFTCAETLCKEPGLIEALENVVRDGKNKSAQKQAKGALWILHGQDKQSARLHTRETTARGARRRSLQLMEDSMQRLRVITDAAGAFGGGGDKGDADSDCDDSDEEEQEELPHIMISYQWGVQPTMLQVRDRLIEAGYKVWMDVDEMSGSILEAMANAVEKSAVVIICMAQKYKESPNCRTEAEYTFRLKKDIIPLRVEHRYSPDGWLGALVGNKLFFDFSVQEKFDKSMQSVIKELGSRGKLPDTPTLKPQKAIVHSKPPPQPVHHTPAPIPVPTPAPAPPHKQSPPSLPSGVVAWTEDEVQDWLSKHSLGHQHQACFRGMDGSLLQELACMRMEAPEFFYTHLKTDYHMPLLSLLKLTKALKQL